MPKRTVEKTKQFDCPRCNRSVTFTYHQLQFVESSSGDIFASTFDRVTDYGECLLAAEAGDPARPSKDKIRDCPFYQMLGGV